MKAYELLLLLNPSLDEEARAGVLDKVQGVITADGGVVDAVDPWGKRKLAYEIDKKADGNYHLLLFSAEPETLDEITRVLKIDDAVLRHMATRHIAGSRTSAPRSVSTLWRLGVAFSAMHSARNFGK